MDPNKTSAENTGTPPEATSVPEKDELTSPLKGKFNLFQGLAIFLLFVSLAGLFTPWYGYSMEINMSNPFNRDDAFKSSQHHNEAFIDFFISEPEASEMKYKNEKEKEYIEKINTTAEKSQGKNKTGKALMKWFGLIGFIAAFAAIVLAFASPRIMTFVSLFAAICFVTAFIGALMWASAANEVWKDWEDYSRAYIAENEIWTDISELYAKARVCFGLIISLVCSSAAAVLASVGTFIVKKQKEMPAA